MILLVGWTEYFRYGFMAVVDLVTGGAGFIGSHVARRLIDQGRHVVILDDLSGGFTENVPLGADLVRGSITDERLVDNLFREHRFARVYHFAAYAAENLSDHIKRHIYSNIVVGGVTLINAAVNHEAECFVYASSVAVYGHGAISCIENATASPDDSYGLAKLTIERELKLADHRFGLNYIVFRLHNVYGERQNIWDRYRNVVGIFMNQSMLGEPMTIYGSGQQSRQFTYIGDVVGVLAEAPNRHDAYANVFNLGSDESTPITEVAHKVAALFGVKPAVRYLRPRTESVHPRVPHEKVHHYFPESRQMRALEVGLPLMANWARGRGPRRPTPSPGIEISRNLPENW